MRIFVTAKPSSKNPGAEKIDDTHFVVRVKEPPREGRANYAVLEALAEHLGIPLSHIYLASGAASRQKVVEIF